MCRVYQTRVNSPGSGAKDVGPPAISNATGGISFEPPERFLEVDRLVYLPGNCKALVKGSGAIVRASRAPGVIYALHATSAAGWHETPRGCPDVHNGDNHGASLLRRQQFVHSVHQFFRGLRAGAGRR